MPLQLCRLLCCCMAVFLNPGWMLLDVVGFPSSKIVMNPVPGLSDLRARVQQRQAYSKCYTSLKRGNKALIFTPGDSLRVRKPNTIKKGASGYTAYAYHGHTGTKFLCYGRQPHL